MEEINKEEERTIRKKYLSTYSNMIYSQVMKSHRKTNKESSFMDHTKLLLGILFHYSDAFSDINTIIQIYFYVEELKKNGVQVLYIIVIAPICSIIIERCFSYQLAIQLEKKLAYKKNNNIKKSQYLKSQIISNYEVSKKRKILILLSVITFSESLLIWKALGKEGGVSKYILKKNLNELCYENLMFLYMGIFFTVRKVYIGLPISFMDTFQVLTSFISTVITMLNLQVVRIQKEPNQIKKQLSDFSKFPYEVQLLLSDPCHIQIMKSFEIDFKEHKHHFYVENDQQNTGVSQLENLKNEGQGLKKISKWKMVYIFAFTFIIVTGDSFLFISQIFAVKGFQDNIIFGLSFLYLLPQCFIHFKLYLKKNSKSKLLVYAFKILILKWPLIVGASLANFMLPFINYQIPFIKETRAQWAFNYAPNSVNLIYSICIFSYFMYIILDLVMYSQEYNWIHIGVFNGKDFQRNDGLYFWIIFYCILSFGFLSLFFKVLSVLYAPKIEQNGYQRKECQLNSQQSCYEEQGKIKQNVKQENKIKEVQVEEFVAGKENLQTEFKIENQNEGCLKIVDLQQSSSDIGENIDQIYVPAIDTKKFEQNNANGNI